MIGAEALCGRHVRTKLQYIGGGEPASDREEGAYDLDAMVARQPFLQTVSVRGAGVETLGPLGGLRDLVSVDAPGNNLEEALDFETPDSSTCSRAGWVGSNVQVANLSHNCIRGLRGLSQHRHLRTLKLNDNRLEHVGDLSALRQLEFLDLSANNIASLEHIGELPALRELLVSENRLVSLRGVGGAPKLRRLDCALNDLEKLGSLSQCPALLCVDVRANKISAFGSLEPLAGLRLLSELLLARNPVERYEHYRKRALFRCQQLSYLDQHEVTAEEKVRARAFFGAEQEAMARAFADVYGPDEPPFSFAVARPFQEPQEPMSLVLPCDVKFDVSQAVGAAKHSTAVVAALPGIAAPFVQAAIATATRNVAACPCPARSCSFSPEDEQ